MGVGVMDRIDLSGSRRDAGRDVCFWAGRGRTWEGWMDSRRKKEISAALFLYFCDLTHGDLLFLFACHAFRTGVHDVSSSPMLADYKQSDSGPNEVGGTGES